MSVKESRAACLVVAFLTAIFAVVSATSPGKVGAQTGDDLCRLLPSGSDFTDTSEPGLFGSPTGGSAKAVCAATYPSGPVRQLHIFRFSDADDARKFETVWDPGSERVANLGDAAHIAQHTGSSELIIMFSRNCYAGLVDSRDRDAALAAARKLDATLAAQPPCPTPPAAQTTELEATLACNVDGLQSSGDVICAATPVNQQPNASIVYEWTFDGQIQPAVTGSSLVLSGVTPGSHSVSVVARDTVNNLSSQPQTESFVRGKPGGSAAAGGPYSLVPLIAGAAIGIPIVLGIIISIRSRRRRQKPGGSGSVRQPSTPIKPNTLPGTTDASPSPPPAKPSDLPGILPGSPSALTMASSEPGGLGPSLIDPPSLVMPKPDTLPEQVETKRDKKKQDTASIVVKLIVSPSVRTRSVYAQNDPHIWGDGIDLVVVGYSLTIAAGWRLDGTAGVPIKDEYQVTPSQWTRVQQTRLEGARGLADRYADRTFTWTPVGDATAGMIVAQAPWSFKDGSLAIHVKVTASLINDKGQTASGVSAEDSKSIPVIGAKPHLKLEPASDFGYADGTDTIKITPVLTMFDQTYAGGLEVSRADYFFPRVKILATRSDEPSDHLFEASPEKFRITTLPGSATASGEPLTQADPEFQKRQQGVFLRCKFLLDKAPLYQEMGGGDVTVSFPVSITGVGFDKEHLDTADIERDFGWMPKESYRACAEHWVPLDDKDIEPAEINLLASTIELTPPNPVRLPRGDGPDRFTSTLSARVRSPIGRPVAGSTIRGDHEDFRLTEWGFGFYYDPPQEPWRRKIDNGRPEESAEKILATPARGQDYNLDEQGCFLFEGQTSLVYDHSKVFLKTLDDTGKNTYLQAQTCDLNVEFIAGDCSYPAGIIHIDAVDSENYTLTVQVKAQSKEGLPWADVSVLPANSTTPITLRTDENGEAKVTVPGRANPYKLHVSWLTDPKVQRNYSDGEWLSGSGGTSVPGESQIELTGDDTHEEILAVSSQWALQMVQSGGLASSLPPWVSKWMDEFSHHLPDWKSLRGIKELPKNLQEILKPSASLGGVILFGYLIDRAIMKTGTLEASIKDLHPWSAPTDPNAYRRVIISGIGVAAGVSLPALSAAVSSPPGTDFITPRPVSWLDFHNTLGLVTAFEASAGVVGTSWGVATFAQVATDPTLISISGDLQGLPDITGQVVAGVWQLWRGDL